MSSSVVEGAASPSTLCTDNRYCAMVDASVAGGGAYPAIHPCYERATPRSTRVYKKSVSEADGHSGEGCEPLHRSSDSEIARVEHSHQARPARSCPGCGLRLRERARRSWRP